MKSILVGLFCLTGLGSNAFAAFCPQAVEDNLPEFCTSFKSVAECHCTMTGLPQGMCQNVNIIYDRMVSIFGSQDKACQYQQNTSFQSCMDDWNCYRMGGKDSQGRLCSNSGDSCIG